MTPHVKIKDLSINYTVSRRDVKYPRLEFKTGELLLVLPKNYESPEELIEKKKTWIYNKQRFIDAADRESRKKKTVERSEKEFRSLVHHLLEKLSKDSTTRVNRVFFRTMHSKWASLSKQRNLTVNTMLRYLPDHLIEYVLYHELAHLKEKRHNERYWKIISQRYPDHQAMEKELFAYWFLVQTCPV